MRLNTHAYSFPLSLSFSLAILLFYSLSLSLSIYIFCFLFFLHTYPQNYGSAHAYFPIVKTPISYSSFLSLVFAFARRPKVYIVFSLVAPNRESTERACFLLLRENSACHGEKPVPERLVHAGTFSFSSCSSYGRRFSRLA